MATLLVFGAFGVVTSPGVHAELPPRPVWPPPTPEPTRVPEAAKAPKYREPIRVVAPILLTVNSTDQKVWTVVEWADTQGAWHEVTGWRGTPANGVVRWWVEEKDFGKGPFRWVVYLPNEPAAAIDQDNTDFSSARRVLATSGEFYLPTKASAGLNIQLTVPVQDD